MIAATRRGLAYEAMERMTLGQVVDYCIECDNQELRAKREQEHPPIRRMTQDEINAFLG